MKLRKLFLIMFLALAMAVPAEAVDYEIIWVDSPNRRKFPDLSVRGIAGSGEFSATMSKRPPDCPIGYINCYRMKGLFGKFNPDTGNFRFLEVYESDPADWNMGFAGMASNRLVTALKHRRYNDPEDTPEDSAVMKWQHVINSMGFQTSDDVHVNRNVAATGGRAYWRGGVMSDINKDGIAVGFFIDGDSATFDTNTGEFVRIWDADQGAVDGPIRLFGISNNGWAVGDALKQGEPGNINVLVNITNGNIRWTQALNPEVQWDPGYWDPNVGINNTHIVWRSGNVFKVWNHRDRLSTPESITEIPFHEEMLDYEEIYLTDISGGPGKDATPILVGYGYTPNRKGKWQATGFIMYPVPVE